MASEIIFWSGTASFTGVLFGVVDGLLEDGRDVPSVAVRVARSLLIRLRIPGCNRVW